MKRKIVVIDTETGGLDAEQNSLLSITLVVVHGGGIDATLPLSINDPSGTVEDVTVSIHGLTAEYCKLFGSTPGEAVDQIEDFLLMHDFRDPRKVTLGGCQTDFDVNFLKRLYRLAGKDYGTRYDRRVLDISHGALLLEQAGRLDLRGDVPSLENICRAVGVALDRPNGVHTSIGDATATAKVLSRMIDMLRINDYSTRGTIGTDRAVSV